MNSLFHRIKKYERDGKWAEGLWGGGRGGVKEWDMSEGGFAGLVESVE